MKIISHRGNINGSNPETENKIESIINVLNLGFDCEIDVWNIDGKFYLGHDKPNEEISSTMLSSNYGLWCHAKNLSALEEMLRLGVHCFWHENDDFTLTSRGYIWTFPNKKTGKKSIIVDNSKYWIDKSHNCFAVCTDWIKRI